MPSILHSSDTIEVTAELLAPQGVRVGDAIQLAANGAVRVDELRAAHAVDAPQVSIGGNVTLLLDGSACVASLILRDTPYEWGANGALRAEHLLANELTVTGPTSLGPASAPLTVADNGTTHISAALVLGQVLRAGAADSRTVLDTARNLQNIATAQIEERLVLGGNAFVASANGSVGIQTTAPRFDLDVHGDVHFAQRLFANAALVWDASAQRLQNVAQAQMQSVNVLGDLRAANTVLLSAPDRILSNLAVVDVEALRAASVAIQQDLRLETGDVVLRDGQLRMGPNAAIILSAHGRHLGNVVTAHLGNAALVLDEAGRVGLGTTSPEAALDVASGFVRLRQGLQREDGAVVLDAEGALQNVTSLQTEALTVGDAHLFVPPSGRVGVNNDAPTAALDVAGDIRFSDVLRGAFPFLTTDGHLANLVSLQVLNGADRSKTALHVDVNGRVGLGTDAPAYDVDIAGTLHLQSELQVGAHTVLDAERNLQNIRTAAIGQMDVGEGAILVPAAGPVVAGRRLVAADALVFETTLETGDGTVVLNQARELSVQGAVVNDLLAVGGALGVGTAQPQEALDVAGVARAQGLRIDSLLVLDAAANLMNIANASIDGTLSVADAVSFTGPVAIGDVSTPLEIVHVKGNAIIEGDLRVRGTTTFVNTEVQTTSAIWITNEGVGPAGRFNQIGSERILELQNNGENLLIVDQDGFVGIGTENPQSRLDLHGSLSIGGVPVLDEMRILSNVTLSSFDGSKASQIVASRLEPFTGSLGTGVQRKVYLLPDDVEGPPEDTAGLNALLLRSRLDGISVERALVVDADETGLLYEFIGYLRVETTGVYAFGLNSQDSSELYLNNALVAHWYGEHPPRTNPNVPGGEQKEVALTAGYHRLYLRTCTLANPFLELYWRVPEALEFEPVPITAFYLAGFDTICASTTGAETLLLGTVNVTASALPVQGVGTCLYPSGPLTGLETTIIEPVYGLGEYSVEAAPPSPDAWSAFHPEGWSPGTQAGTPVRLRLTLPTPVCARYTGLSRPVGSSTLYVRLFVEDPEVGERAVALNGRDGYVPVTTAGDLQYFRTPVQGVYDVYVWEFLADGDDMTIRQLQLLGGETVPLSVYSEDVLESISTAQLYLTPDAKLGLGTDVPREALDVHGGGVVVSTGRDGPDTVRGGYVRLEDPQVGPLGTYGLQTLEGKLRWVTDTAEPAIKTLLQVQQDGAVGIGALAPAARLDVRPSAPLVIVPPAPLEADSNPDGHEVSASVASTAGPLYELFQGEDRPDLRVISVRLADPGYRTVDGTYLGVTETLLQNGETLRGAWFQLQLPEAVSPARFQFLARGLSTDLDEAPRHVVLVGSANGVAGTWVRLAESTGLDPRDQWAPVEWTPEAAPSYRYVRWIIRSVWGVNREGVSLARVRLYAQPLVADPVALRTQGRVLLEQGNVAVETDPTDPRMSLAWFATGIVDPANGGFTDGRFVYVAPSVTTANVASGRLQIFDGRRARLLGNVLTSNTTTVTGAALNGTYVASASSLTAGFPAYFAFDGNATQVWRSSVNVYQNATGEYIGAQTTVDDRGSSYAGEWVQLELPSAIHLEYYSLRSAVILDDALYYGPRLFRLFGSNSGASGSWRLLDRQQVDRWTTETAIFTPDPVTPTAYRFYRLVVASVGSSDLTLVARSRNVVYLTAFHLFDRVETTPTAAAIFERSLSVVNGAALGFAGGCFDGTFGYAFPSGNEGGVPHGLLLRFARSPATAPEVLDLATLDPSFKGFRGGLLDGRFLYLIPTLGKTPRIDTTTFALSTVATTGSPGVLNWWSLPELANAIFSSGVVLQGHLYVACESRGFLARVPLQTFQDSAISFVSLVEAGFTEGFTSMVTLNGYLFAVSNGVRNGKVVRIDVRAWETGGSPVIMDLSANPVLTGFRRCVTDGRYGYLIPFRNAGGFHGNVVRWDPMEFPRWSYNDHVVLNVTNLVGSTDAAGFTDAIVANRMLYLLPSYRAPDSRGATLVAIRLGTSTDPVAGTARIASEQVVLGRDPRARVAVQGALRVAAEGVEDGLSIEVQGATMPTASALRISHPRFQHVFDGSGRLGIRTSNPTHELDVFGSVAANGLMLRMGGERSYRFFQDITITGASGTITRGLRLSWPTAALSVQQAFRVMARCTVVSSPTEHAFRRVELLVHPMPGASTPGELVMLDSSMYFSAGFSALTHMVTRHNDTAVNVQFRLTSTLASYRISVDLEVVAPLELGRFTAALI